MALYNTLLYIDLNKRSAYERLVLQLCHYSCVIYITFSDMFFFHFIFNPLMMNMLKEKNTTSNWGIL